MNELNKTIKLTNKSNIKHNKSTRTMSKKRNKTHYLAETISSINKKNVKFDNTNNRPLIINNRPLIINSLHYSSTPTYNKKLSQTNCFQKQTMQQNFFKSQNSRSFSKKCDFNDNNIYYDNLHHFSSNADFGNDPFGHFD